MLVLKRECNDIRWMRVANERCRLVTPGLAVGGNISINAQKVSGASLQLSNPARSRIVSSSRLYQDYIKKNHASWVELATEEFGIDCKPEDVVISRGWVKSTEWAVTSFKSSYSATSAGVLANAAVVAGGRVSFSLANGHPLLQVSKQGPQRDPVFTLNSPPCDQCVFLPVYKVRRRLVPFLPRKIEAGAGPHQLPPGDREGDAGGDLQVIADPGDRSVGLS